MGRVNRGRICCGLAVAAVVLVPSGGTAKTPQTRKAALLHVVAGMVRVGSIPLFRGAEPAWSTDGSQIAFTRGYAVWLANADGSGTRELTPGAQPTWSPAGALVYVRGGKIVRDGKMIARGRHPSFSAKGTLAYDTKGMIVAGRRTLTPGEDPAWSPDGHAIAFVRDGDLHAIGANGSSEAQLTTLGDVTGPAWSPDGRQILFSSGGAVRTFAVKDGTIDTLARGFAPDWKIVPTARELLPDWDQQRPANIFVMHRGNRRLLAFRSAAANVGRGPFWIVASRKKGQTLMPATQIVVRSDGTRRTIEGAGHLRYDTYPPHHHWHLHPFERYELWSTGASPRPVARDSKRGFCLGDHFRTRRAVAPRFPPFQCGNFNPGATAITEGTSVGFVDIYPAAFHGQWIDITGVRDGRYALVHRANPEFKFRERNYDNNVSAALVQLRNGTVRVLGTCDRLERCL